MSVFGPRSDFAQPEREAPPSHSGVVSPRPVVLISCSHSAFEVSGIGQVRYHAVFERYVDAVSSTLDCIPLLLPALGGAESRIAEYVRLADGALLTGAISNIAPAHYGRSSQAEAGKCDPARDQTTLPFVRLAVADGLPLLGICRGLQEINVALGGTLDADLHQMPGRFDHRAPPDRPLAERYLPAHALRVHENSWLERMLLARGIDPRALRVNSLHGQAIAELGRSVVAEATADDGTIEAIRVAGAPALTLGVQWHAEWYLEQTPLHAAIFDELRQACWKRHACRVRAAASWLERRV